jgi:hypothetical protein
VTTHELRERLNELAVKVRELREDQWVPRISDPLEKIERDMKVLAVDLGMDLE